MYVQNVLTWIVTPFHAPTQAITPCWFACQTRIISPSCQKKFGHYFRKPPKRKSLHERKRVSMLCSMAASLSLKVKDATLSSERSLTSVPIELVVEPHSWTLKITGNRVNLSKLDKQNNSFGNGFFCLIFGRNLKIYEKGGGGLPRLPAASKTRISLTGYSKATQKELYTPEIHDKYSWTSNDPASNH